MFKELASIVNKGTNLCIMVSAASEGNLMVTVLPQGKDQNAALNTPLSVTATPEELDAELPAALCTYVGHRSTLAESLENVKTIMEAAGKTASAAATKAATKANDKTTSVYENEGEEGEGDEEGDSVVPARSSSDAPASSSKSDVLSLF